MKKSLLLILLMALLAPWTVSAQVVTIGTGTTTHNSAPIANYFNYSLAEMIFTAEEISAGNPSVSTILSLGFEGAAASSKTYEVTIYMKNVDAVSFIDVADFIPVSTSDVVFTGSIKPKAGWNTLDLEVPFTYDNTKSLLVVVNKTSKSYDGSTSIWKYTSTSSTYKMLYTQKDSDPAYDPTTPPSLSLNYERPNVQLTFGAPASCPKPSGLTASDITANSVKLNWTEIGTATSWQICLNDDETNLINAGENPYTLSNLEPLSSYSVKVRSVCSEYSDWSNPISFSTTAEAESVGDSWSDNFEGATCGWELINGNLTNAWAWGTATNNGGTHSLYISKDAGATYEYASGTSFVYATKLLSFTDGKFILSYDWQANGESNYDYLRAWLAPSSATFTPGALPDGTTYPSSYTNKTPTGWIALDGGSKLNLVTAWQTKEVVTNVAAGNYYFVFMWCNDGSGGSQPPAAVDNVNIVKLACPYDVADLAVSSISTSGATLTWTAGEATQWQVAYADNSSFENAIEEIVSSANKNLIGLQSASKYYVKVRAYCGNTDFGAWSDAISFATECEAIDLSAASWPENFDSYTAASGFLPICWNRINTCTYSYYGESNYPKVSNYGANTSPNCLYLYSYYSDWSDYDPQPQYAILPEMSDLAGKQITLQAKGYNTSSTFKIGTMADPADATTFHQIAEQTGLTTAYQEYVFDISNTTDSYVAIMIDAANSTRSTNGVYIDDIVIANPPACPKPTELAYSEVEKRSVKLSWINGGEETKWNVAYKADGDADYTIQTADSNPYTLSGLEAETDYVIKVQADCGDSQSDWSNEVNFTTLIGCVVPTGLSTSELGSNSVKLSWTSSESESYEIRHREVTENYSYKFDFEDGQFPTDLTHSGSYGFEIVSGQSESGNYCVKSSNGGVSSSTAEMVLEVNLSEDQTLSFLAKVSSESGWDKGGFSIDGTVQSGMNDISGDGAWIAYNYDLPAGTHTLRWYYTKDGSGDTNDDCLYVDDIAIKDVLYSDWSSVGDITEVSYVLGGLTPETKYEAQLRANCGTDDGFSSWTDSVVFVTLANCAVPFNLTASEATAHGAKLAWEGNSDSYEISVSKIGIDKSYEYNFEDGQFPAELTHSGTYGFEIVSGQSESGNYCVKSGNGGESSSTAEMILEVNLSEDKTLSFLAKVSSESGWDKAYFSIDGTAQSNLNGISGDGAWIAYNYDLPAGTHTLRWYYTKDGSGNKNDDCLYVDDIVIGVSSVVPVENYPVSESPYVLNDAAKIDPETTYVVTVKGICGGNPTEASAAIQFTTLPSCLPVSDLDISNIGAHSASFTWTASALAETQWQFAWVAAGATPESWSLVSTAAVEVSGLNSNTSYDFYVRAYCGSEDQSGAIMLNFRTECDVVSLPFSCGFENTDDLACWTLVDCHDNTGRYEGYAYEGSYSFKFRYNTNPPQYLISPELEASTNSVKVDFYYKKSSNYEETFQVGYSTTNKSADSFIWDDEVEAAMTYQRYSAVYPAGVKYVAIKYTANDQLALYIDNFKVHEFVPYVLGINASRYATYYNADDAYIMPNGLVGHIFNATDKLVQVYDEDDVVPAGVPLVLEGNAGNYQLVPTLDAGVAPTGTNDLIGNNEAGIIGSATDGYVYYVLSMNASSKPESVGFYYMLDEGKGGFSMPAHKAYLKYAASSAPARFYLFNGENGATWLNSLEGVEGTVKFLHEGNIYILRDSIIYDATGRKVRELK